MIGRRGAQALLSLIALALACASPVADIEPGTSPTLEAEEAGFWLTMEKVERNIASSGYRMRDPELETYVKGVVCRVAPDYCDATRVYVMREPDFNASMYPNGMMVVFSGLLLRMQNEAQLATVLGHEVGHYQRRHLLARYRAEKKTLNALLALSYALSAVGGVAAGNAMGGTELIAFAALMKYNRNHEAESDRIGIERLAKAGYDPREASEVWSNLIRESEADPDRGLRMPLFSTHPAEASRWTTLREAAAALVTPENARVTRAAELAAVVAPRRAALIADEITMRRHERTMVVLDQLEESELITHAEAAFYRAELHRVRDEKGDALRAIAFYREAITGKGAPPIAHRNLGLLLRRQGEAAAARAAFARYVELAPEAADRAMVDSYIQELSR